MRDVQPAAGEDPEVEEVVFGEAPAKRSRKALVIGSVAAALVGGAVLWSLPGAGALEGSSGLSMCRGGVPAGQDAAVTFMTHFTNHSSLPVTVTKIGVEKTSSLNIVATRIAVDVPEGTLLFPAREAGLTLAAQEGQQLGSETRTWNAGDTVAVKPDQTLTVGFVVQSSNRQQWDGRASGVRVDYHAWTQAPQNSVDGSEVLIISGEC